MSQVDAPQAMTLRLGDDDRATAWIVFAAALLATLGTLNVIDGIAAASNSQFFVRHAHYLLGDLGAWDWTLVVVGICQALAGWVRPAQPGDTVGGRRLRGRRRPGPDAVHARLPAVGPVHLRPGPARDLRPRGVRRGTVSPGLRLGSGPTPSLAAACRRPVRRSAVKLPWQ